MNEKITFPRLATLLADRSRRSKRFSEDFLREFFALISERLEEGESVKIKGLGTFRLSRVEPRRSVDVTTGLPMEISGHSKVVFVPSKELADAVNAPFEAFTAIEISDDADLSEILSKDEISIQESSDDFSAEADFGMASDSQEEPMNEPSDEDVISFSQKVEPEIPEKDADIPDDETERHSESVEKASEDVNEEINSTDIADNNDEADNTDSDQSGQTEDSEDSSEQTSLSTDYSEDYEELETVQSRRNWVRTIMISLGAALFALIATFTIWYIFATNDFKNIFNSKTADTPTEGFVVGHNAIAMETPSITGISEDDSVYDTLQEPEEEEVPTAPSDAPVYDTISTTRYLTTMAKVHYGNYNLWPYIYEENKAILGHPDRIRPGTPVVIPKLSKYGVDPSNPDDVNKAKKMGVEIYARYGKKI